MKLLFKNKRYILLISVTIFIVFCTHISSYADKNSVPVFIDGGRAIRTIAENTPAGVKIGAPVAATDADNDTLTYNKGWIDGMAFSIDTDTGQIRTKAPLDYETKNAYWFAIFVDDGNGGKLAISVTINVTDVNETPANNAPIFTNGDSTTRTVAENTAAGVKIGAPVAATDADNDTLTYSLGGTDAASFSINSTNGQLRTSAALDYETKTSYSVTVSASDGNGGSDSITVTINVMDVTGIDPPLSDRTQQVCDAIVAAIPGVYNADDVTAAHLAVITELNINSKGITSLKSGDFNGLTALTELDLGSNSISDISPLEGLTTLTELKLRRNSISDISVLENLTALTTLDLDYNSISDISALDDLTALTTLSLNYNSTSDISALKGLTALTHLYLQSNSISDISALKGLTALTTLSLRYNSISDISALENLTALTHLFLTGNPISDYGPLHRLVAAIREAGRSLYVEDIAILEEGRAPSVEVSPVIPDNTVLLTNFPNPFNPETWIPYQLAKPAEVTLTIYDIRGVVVREMKLGHQAAGFYQSRSRAIYWDGRNAFGKKVATGVYFYTLIAGDFTATRKLLIRK